MKKLLITVLMLTILSHSKAQGTVDLQITQDLKLAAQKDDYGNNPFTTDLRIEVNLNGGNSNSANWGFLGINYEWADLYGGRFVRCGFQGGWAFKDEVFGIVYQAEPHIGAGTIRRGLSTIINTSLEAGLNLSFKINKHWNLISKNNLMQRGDLDKYNDNSASYRPWHWKTNWAIGIRYSIYLKKTPPKEESEFDYLKKG